MAHDDQSQAKEIIAKVMRQIKNDGTFGSLIKKAVFELEEEGFFDLLRVRFSKLRSCHMFTGRWKEKFRYGF